MFSVAANRSRKPIRTPTSASYSATKPVAVVREPSAERTTPRPASVEVSLKPVPSTSNNNADYVLADELKKDPPSRDTRRLDILPMAQLPKVVADDTPRIDRQPTLATPNAESNVAVQLQTRERPNSAAPSPKQVREKKAKPRRSILSGGPRVVMTEHHQAMCLKNVNDNFADVMIETRAGNRIRLDSFLDKPLTIVVFWDVHQAMSRDQILWLRRDVLDRVDETEVKVLTVHVGNDREEATKFLASNGLRDGVYFDQRLNAFHKVATDLLPRTYLLRSDGTIAWFDCEYSQHMLFEMREAIEFFVRHALKTAKRTAPDVRQVAFSDGS